MYIKSKLNEKLEIYKNLRQIGLSSKSSHKFIVTVGVGGNVGDVKRRFIHLLNFFKRDKRVSLIGISSILKNPPFGFLEQDDFFNAVILLKTDMQPSLFLNYLMRVEKMFLRKRSFENAPRTLDLDIIFFDNRVINKKNLKIPHVEWFKRESVLIPLMDLYK